VHLFVAGILVGHRRDLVRHSGGEAQVGVPHVRRGRQRSHRHPGNDQNSSGNFSARRASERLKERESLLTLTSLFTRLMLRAATLRPLPRAAEADASFPPLVKSAKLRMHVKF
jgi:hypothetical protein